MSGILPINVEDTLRGRGIESNRLEFKATWSEDVGNTGDQVLRTLCAFANDLQNLNGGYVFLGVEEEDSRAKLPPRGLTAREIERAQKWIQGNCRKLAPEYQPVLSPEVVEGQDILVVWCPGSDTRPHQAPETSEKKAARHYYVRQGNQTVIARGEMLTQLMQTTAKVPFDDRINRSAAIEKLREGRVREFLSDVRSSLLEERDPEEMYRRMRISARINGHEVPRNVGLLFFSDDPEIWFPGTRIEVAHFADDAAGNVIEERVFRGPLQHQLRECLNYLNGFSTRHLEKQGDRPEVKGWVSYPLPAMEESLVNAVYHRSYEDPPEPIKIYLYPDRIELISYPGPVPGIERHHFDPGQRVPPVPARNRRIGELLKELRLAEGRGTGVPKVYRAMAQNGSPRPEFDFDPARTYFRVVLPAHPEYVAIAALRDAAHLRAIGDSKGAVERLQRALSEQPHSPTIVTALIEDLCRAGDVDSALALYGRFGKTDAAKQAPAVHLAMAFGLLEAQRVNEAFAILDQLPAMLDPDKAIQAAILERRAGRQEKAHQHFQQAGEAVFRDVRALHEFAQTKMRLTGQMRRDSRASRFERDARMRVLREAKEMLERVIQMDAPQARHAWAWFDLGRVLEWMGAPRNEVRHALEEACRLAPGEARFCRELENFTGGRREGR